ncbi:hypothetical protein [Microbacterium lushaniae]|uniref:Transcriptional regulator, AbiEi antitoxin, Type IV TA system n=1 Tax=Microbacterium lushaniae TaxID=2614639 RepID=A0A5J6L0S6_9MICO|nr:hypothetical protein [Microbacterium lushaniae]QEW02075.1 hypothetical protein F6J85_02495 [Microbacterium lushaniae]
MQTNGLLLTSDLGGEGREATLAAGVRSGAVVRIRHGAYIDAGRWDAASSEERTRLRTRAFVRACASPPVIAFTSAAAEWDLPGFRVRDDRVHTLDPGAHPARSRADVFRHSGPLPPEDVEVRDGILVTSLPRTIADVIRMVSVEAAVAYFDAALRVVAWRGHGLYDLTAAEAFRAGIHARLDAMPGARGIRQARFVTDFADGRAQLPGESVSRLWMQRLGVPAPILQLEVLLAGGRRAYPDFAWPMLRRFGAFDGDGKYLDPAMARGLSVRDVLRTQRTRESELCAATDWTPVRWGSERLTGIDAFAAFLRSHQLLR